MVTGESKTRWAGCVTRLNDNQWMSRVAEWYPKKENDTRPPSTEMVRVSGVATRDKRLELGLRIVVLDVWLHLNDIKSPTPEV